MLEINQMHLARQRHSMRTEFRWFSGNWSDIIYLARVVERIAYQRQILIGPTDTWYTVVTRKSTTDGFVRDSVCACAPSTRRINEIEIIDCFLACTKKNTHTQELYLSSFVCCAALFSSVCITDFIHRKFVRVDAMCCAHRKWMEGGDAKNIENDYSPH